MPRPYSTRKPLPGPEYRYDSYGRIIKRKRLPYGPRHSQFEGHGLDFSGNRENLIYFGDVECGTTTGIIKAEHVERMKRLADLSGNPKVWTAESCDQAFLRSLIPGSMV